VLEGDEITLEVEVDARDSASRLELLVEVPRGLELVSGKNPVGLRLEYGEERLLELGSAPPLGRVQVRRDSSAGPRRGGAVRLGGDDRPSRDAARLPRPEVLRALVAPRETQLFTGNRVSRQKGEGLEFADLRPFAHGDRIRRSTGVQARVEVSSG
jgi:uncharacterized protein (DUF58 family)